MSSFLEDTDSSVDEYTVINFDNLDEQFYRNVYYPKFKKIDKEETGFENKVGGIVPFFIEGEEWPICEYNGTPLTFFGQFTDIRENNQFLYRIFVPIDDPEEYMFNSVITKIELNEENLSKKIIVKKPDAEDDDNTEEITSYIAYEITSWKKTKELIQYNDILKHFSIYDDEIIFEKYENSIYAPSWGIKIGGTSVFCQYTSDLSKFDNFFQISFCEELPFEWGDSGVAHIYQKDNSLWLEFDCC